MGVLVFRRFAMGVGTGEGARCLQNCIPCKWGERTCSLFHHQGGFAKIVGEATVPNIVRRSEKNNASLFPNILSLGGTESECF